MKHLQRGAEGRRLPGHLLPVQRCRHRTRLAVRRRQAHLADQLHRLHARRPHRRRARRAAHGPLAARTRRQQRDHRRCHGGPETRHPGDRVRRGRHGRPALHDDTSPVRARIHLRRCARHARRSVQAGRKKDRRPDRREKPDGSAQQPRRSERLSRRDRKSQGQRRQGRHRRRARSRAREISCCRRSSRA